MKFLQGLLLVAGVWICCEGAYTLHVLRPKLLVTVENVDRATIAAGVAASHLEKGSDIWLQASKTQATETTKAMRSVNAVAERASILLSRTDDSLNANLLPSLTKTIQDQNGALLESESFLKENLLASQKLLLDADAQIN